MRRLVLAILFVAAAGLALLFSIYGPEPGAPRFRPPPSQEAMRSFAFRQYEFLSPCPFEGGKMWILAWSGATNFHYLLFDIEQRRVIGELTNATPAFMNRDQTRLLCVSRGPARTLVGTFARLIERISWGGIRFPKPNLDTEVFWALDLNKNTSVRIGQSSQLQGQSSYFQPSPDFRLGHNRVWTGALTPGFLVCDLEKNLLTHINAPGVPAGWWDNQTIVLKEAGTNFVLHDVVTRKTSAFVSAKQISSFLSKAAIPDADPGRANVFTIWNGRENEFYLTDTHKKWQATNSFLAKIERPNGGLKLLARDFKFEWSDHLDASGSLYLYSGRTDGDRSDAVLLRNMKDNTETTLVASDGTKLFSIPRFYGHSAIYVRSNMLWRIDLNGSNNTRLFPLQ